MKQDVYIVMHIRKNAGRTLRANFELNFGWRAYRRLDAHDTGLDPRVGLDYTHWQRDVVRDHVRWHCDHRVRALFGHDVYWGIEEGLAFAVEPRYIVFLRDPVERAISRYFYQRRAHRDVHEVARRMHDEDWSIETWWEESRAILDTRDGQVRHLLLGSYPEVQTELKLGREHLEEAKKRLAKFWWTGVVEHFDADALYLYGTLDFWRFHTEKVVNASKRDRPVSDDIRSAIASENTLDAALFAFGQELRAKRVAALGSKYASQQHKAANRMRLYDTIVARPQQIVSDAAAHALRVLRDRFQL